MKFAIAFCFALLAACGSDTGDVADPACSPDIGPVSPRCPPVGSPTPEYYDTTTK